MTPMDGDFARHPAVIRFPLFRVALGLGAAQLMVVSPARGVWHLIDARPPIRDLRAAENVVGSLNGLGQQIGPWLAGRAQDIIDAWLDPRPVAGIPTYDHAQYTSNVVAPSWEPSINFDRVLDIGVGHVHYHQQYEQITGGEMQMLLAPSDPNWFHDHGAVYRFLNGPVSDADGFNDGTCNFYMLAHLADGSYAVPRRAERLLPTLATGHS